MTKRKKKTGESLTDPPLTKRNNLKGEKEEDNLKKQRTEPNLAKGGSPVQSQTQRKASTDQALAVATKEYMKANNIPQAGHHSSGGGLMVPTGYAQSPITNLRQNPLFRSPSLDPRVCAMAKVRLYLADGVGEHQGNEVVLVVGFELKN